MAEIVDVALDRDILMQFKNKPNISALQNVLEHKLYEIEFFFEQIDTIKNIDTAVGQQLDVIGNVVGLTRFEATQLAINSNYFTDMNDDLYKLYLYQKIALNTSTCTYKDMLDSLKIVFGKDNVELLNYAEKEAYPATIFFQLDRLLPYESLYEYLGVWRAKPAGVRLVFEINAEYDSPLSIYHFAAKLTQNIAYTLYPNYNYRHDTQSVFNFKSKVLENIQYNIGK